MAGLLDDAIEDDAPMGLLSDDPLGAWLYGAKRNLARTAFDREVASRTPMVSGAGLAGALGLSAVGDLWAAARDRDPLAGALLAAGATAGRVPRGLLDVDGLETARVVNRGFRNSPKDFITAPSGAVDWGAITPAMELATKGEVRAAPIRVRRGQRGPEGFGYLHVEPDRLEAAKSMGFAGPDDFFSHVATNFNAIVKQPAVAATRNTPGRPERIALVVTPGRGVHRNKPAHNYMVVELEKKDGFYSPTTIIPDAQESYLRSGGKMELWRK